MGYAEEYDGHIVDEEGRVLLMTEMHPIQTPDRGMVMAKHLREGDRASPLRRLARRYV